MATTAYRHLAVVDPRPELDELPEYRRFKCFVCLWDHDKRCDQHQTWHYLGDRYCQGGRHGFLWLRKCAENRPHVHQSCPHCGASYLLAPASAIVREP